MTLNLRRILYILLDFIKIKNIGASQDAINNKNLKNGRKNLQIIYQMLYVQNI